MTESAAQKKISLNFKGLPDAAVQQIASATCGSDTTKDLQRFLAAHLQRMYDDKSRFTSIAQTGFMFFEQIHSSLENLDGELGKLERSRPPSLMTRIMGYGVTTQGAIDGVAKMLGACDSAMIKLRRMADDVHEQLQKRQSLDEMMQQKARELGGQDGIKIIQLLAQHSADFSGTAEKLNRLVDVSRDFEKTCVQMHERADEIVKKQKAYLSGAKVRP
jgi:hypothetical protein